MAAVSVKFSLASYLPCKVAVSFVNAVKTVLIALVFEFNTLRIADLIESILFANDTVSATSAFILVICVFKEA